MARTPGLHALLVVGPTTLSPRQRQTERLCSFGETLASEARKRVMFAFQFSNPDDAERCFDALHPWLSSAAPRAFETRTSLRALLGISPEPAVRVPPRDRDLGGTRDGDPESLEPPEVPSGAATGAATGAARMTTARVMAMMETVTVRGDAGGSASGDVHATTAADATAGFGNKADAEPEPEPLANETETTTDTKETQTSPRPDARSAVEPFTWSSGIPAELSDEIARAYVREMLRGCLAPENCAVSGAEAAFARAPLGAGMPFDRYARLVGEAMDEMIREGDIIVEGARTESDDDENDSLDEDADDERDDGYF